MRTRGIRVAAATADSAPTFLVLGLWTLWQTVLGMALMLPYRDSKRCSMQLHVLLQARCKTENLGELVFESCCCVLGLPGHAYILFTSEHGLVCVLFFISILQPDPMPFNLACSAMFTTGCKQWITGQAARSSICCAGDLITPRKQLHWHEPSHRLMDLCSSFSN